MSINNSFAFDQKRSRKLGKFYNTIDFTVKPDLDMNLYRNAPEQPVVGYFEIGGKSFPVTISELNQIESTVSAAREAVNKHYALNLNRK